MVTMTQKNEIKRSRSFEEAVSLVGFGRYNLYIILATGGSLMAVIIETMCAMFITPAAQCDLELSLSDKGLLYSISFFGVVSSSHLWGYLADTRGRRKVVLVSLVSSAIVSFICSFVLMPWLFILLRFLNGFLISGSSAIVYAFAGEFHDNNFRPRVVSWIATFVAFGNMYLPGMAWLILPHEWRFGITLFDIEFRPWRLLVIVYALPSLFFALLIYFMPESPKYLISKGKPDEALRILARIFSINSGKSESEYPVASIIWLDSGAGVHHQKNEGILRSMWEQTVPLFKKNYIIKTCMVCYLQFSIFMTSSAVIMWYPQILTMMGVYGKVVPASNVTMCTSVAYDEDDDLFPGDLFQARSLASKVCRDNVETEAFLVSLIIGVCYAFCYIFIGCSINILGARKLLIGITTISTVAGVCAQILSGYTQVLITLSIFLMVGTCVGIVNAIVVDLYPTQIRGMALAVSLLFGRLGAMTGSNIGGPIMLELCDYMFFIFTAVHVVVVLFVILLPSNKAEPSEKDKDDS